MAKGTGFERIRRFRRGSGALRREIDDELAFHLEMTIAELRRTGLSEREARNEARRRFGDLERHRRESTRISERNRRTERRGEMLSDLLQDLRFALRNLARNRGFAAVAMLTLALGMAANAVIFGMTTALMFAELPYADPGEVTLIWTRHPERGVDRNSSSLPDFNDYSTRARSFEQIGLHEDWQVNLTGSDEPLSLRGYRVSANLFDLLGVGPLYGRGFIPADESQDADPVIVLSWRLWRRLGGDRSLVGSTLRLNDVAHTVVGVMPEPFEYPQLQFRGDLWAPIRLMPEQLVQERGRRRVMMVGRLADGVSVEQAQAELDAIAEQLERDYPATNTGVRAWVRRISDEIAEPMRPALGVLVVTVGLVLLICCANVANLLLARSSSRRTEVAVRAALGASRGRLVRQLLTESVLLALGGGVLGFAGSQVAGEALVRSLPDFVFETVPSAMQGGEDLRILVLTLAVAVLAGTIFGIAPALRTSGGDLGDPLRSATGGRSGEGPRRRLTSLLVIAEVTMSVILVAAAGLMVKGFVGLLRVDPGFVPEGVMTLRVTLPESRYGDAPSRNAFFSQVLAGLRGQPAVQSAGAASLLPMTFRNSTAGLVIERQPEPAPGAEPKAGYRSATPGYLETMGATLLAGRPILESDRSDTTPVVVVNRPLAERYFPAGDALGSRIRFGGSDEWMTIVGIVSGFRHGSLILGPEPELFYPHAQSIGRDMTFAVRTTGDPSALLPAIRGAIWAVDPLQPVTDVRTMAELVDVSLLVFRLPTRLMAVFAVAALMLAAVGLYGVLSYLVAQRGHEIGVRMALGATRGSVLRLVVGRALALSGVGIALGTAVAILLGRVLSSVLEGVNASEPLVYAGVPALLLAVTALAALAPVRRALAVDPVASLRAE